MMIALMVLAVLFLNGIDARQKNSVLSDEKRLLTDLIADYDKVSTVGRPVNNASKAVTITFALGLIRMDVEEKDNMLVLSTWSKYKWRDDYLTWDPEEYGGIHEIGLPTGYVWIPDVMLYNTASTEKFEREVNLVVDYNGTVRWYPHRIFYSTCSIDVRDFPFDNQTCHLWFGSWTHKVSQIILPFIVPVWLAVDASTALMNSQLCGGSNTVDELKSYPWCVYQGKLTVNVPEDIGSFADSANLVPNTTVLLFSIDLHLDIPEGIDLTTYQSDFKATSKWDITGVQADRMVDEMAVLTFTLYLQRRMIFSSYILTFPVIFMSFLTLLVFWLPSDHADKSNLGMTIFGSLLLLLLILVEAAPPTSAAIPKLGLYYCFNIVIVMLSIFLSSLIAHIGGAGKPMRARKPVPAWLRKLLRMSEKSPIRCNSNGVAHKAYSKNKGSDEEMGHLLDIFKSVSTEGSSATEKLCAALQGYISQRKVDEKRQQEIKCVNQDWTYVATMLDRIIMFIYLLVIIASLIWLFPQ